MSVKIKLSMKNLGLLLISVGMFYTLALIIEKGELHIRGSEFTRANEPILFWLFVILLLGGALSAIYAILFENDGD